MAVKIRLSADERYKMINIDRELEEILNKYDTYSICEKGKAYEDGYAEISKDYKKYQFCIEQEKKEYYLEKIIFDFLLIRDFVNANKQMEKYIELNFNRKKEIKELKKEIEKLINEIQRILNNREQNDIIINWVDAIQYNEIEKMSFLNAKRDKSLFFENSYTVSPWTLPTYYEIFCRKKMVDDHYFEFRKERINQNNSELLRLVYEKGYKFVRTGVCLNIFEDEIINRAVEENEKFDIFMNIKDITEVQKRELNCMKDICPVLQWNALRERIISEKPLFILIHTVAETHSPYISPNIYGDYVNDEFNPNSEQIESSRNYVDEQLKFYEKFAQSSNITRIYMSDHGKNHLDLFHTMLIVENKKLVSQKCDQMFSLIDFTKLIEYVISPSDDKFSNLFRKYVEIQDLDKYKQSRINLPNAIKAKPINWLLGYRAIRSKDFFFARRNDGKEFFYHLPCLVNQIENNIYKDVIDEMRQLTGTYVIDVFVHEYFKHSRISYFAIEHYNERTKEMNSIARKKVKELLCSISNGEIVAFRGGGKHTMELAAELSKDVKIKYIIDKNPEFNIAIPGCRYINVDDVSNFSIDIIIISSYKYHELMYNEMKDKTTAKVIDIYKELISQNVAFEGPLYGDEIVREEDFVYAYDKMELSCSK